MTSYLSPSGDLIGHPLEHTLRAEFRRIAKHHGLPNDGVIEADLVRAFLAKILVDVEATVALALGEAVLNYRLGSGIVDGSYPLWDYDEHVEGMLRALATKI